MLELLINVSNFLSPLFYKILYMSIVGTILGILIFAITKFLDNKLSAKWKCIIWLIPLLFLMIPITRIQINTNKDIAMTLVIDQVETALNNAPKLNYVKLKNNNYEDIEVKDIQKNNIEKNSNQNITLYTIMPIIWIFGLSVSIIIFIIGNINLQYRIKKAKKIKDSRIKIILIKCKAKLNINKKIEIKLQNLNISPCIYGIAKPKILISKEFINQEDKIIENVFMHELSHYKRRDMITNYVLLIMTALHWFNPFVYSFFKKIRQEMELATDEIALNKMNKEEKKQYGLTLINLLKTYETQKVTAKILCITDDNKNMERRIKKIKISTKLKKYSMLTSIFVTITVICSVMPFIIKPSNTVNAQNNNIQNNKTQENIISTNNNQEDIINAVKEDDNELNLAKQDLPNLLGEWKLYKAEYNGQEIPLTQIYGTGISNYGGKLIIKDDGTYTNLLGIYSENIIDDTQGRCEIIGDYIHLTSKSGKEEILEYIEKEQEVIKQEIDDNTYLLYKR